MSDSEIQLPWGFFIGILLGLFFGSFLMYSDVHSKIAKTTDPVWIQCNADNPEKLADFAEFSRLERTEEAIECLKEQAKQATP